MTPTDLKQIEKLLQRMLQNSTTKDDLKNFATKDTLAPLEKKIIKMEATMATKDDLLSLEERVEKRFDQLDKKIDKVEDIAWAIFRSTDDIKSDKSEITRLEGRVKTLERKIAA